MDVLELLRALRPEPYDNNLPHGGPPRPPRIAKPQITKGDVEAHIAARRAELLRQAHDGGMTGDAYAVPPRREPRGALDAGEFSGDAYAVPSGFDYAGLRRKMASALGAPPEPAVVRHEDTELRHGVPARRGALAQTAPAAAPGGGALPPHMNPDGIGHTVGDRRRLTDQQRLDILRAQLTDEARDPISEAELRSEIAALEKRIAGAQAPVADGVKRVSQQQGALATDPWEMGVAESAMQNAVRGALDEDAAPATTVSRPTRTSLADRYTRAVGKIPAAGKGELTEAQRDQAALDFYLRLLANNRPGSRFLQNAGAAGLAVSDQVRDTRQKNLQASRESRREALDEAFRGVGFADKDEDNSQGRERIDLLKQQIEQGKFKVHKSKDGLVLVDERSGKAKLIKDEDGKPLMPTSDNPNIDFYRWLMEDPKRAEFFMGTRNKDKNDSDQIVDAATKLLSADLAMGGRMTADQALEHARRVVLGAKGQAAPAGPNAKPDPVANKGRTITGPDGRFRSDGKQWIKISP